MVEFTRRDKWFIGSIYAIGPTVLFAALLMAFFHAEDWAARHDHGPAWEHWAFAVMIELPALLGILLMTLWPKIGVGRKPTIPRLLFFVAAGLSQLVQQAYAGSGASVSTRFVAGLPSVGSMVFIEIVFWVMGLVEGVKNAESAAAAGPKPTAVPPPPMTLPTAPLAPVPPTAPADAPLDTELSERPVSPWTTPPRAPLPESVAPRDMAADVHPGEPQDRGDKPQATATVPPHLSPSAGGEDMGGQDLPATQDNDAVSPTLPGGHVPQDKPGEDTAPQGDSDRGDKGTAGLDPTDLEMWAHYQNGKTKAELAAMYGCHVKTIQRRLKKVREADGVEEERSNA